MGKAEAVKELYEMCGEMQGVTPQAFEQILDKHFPSDASETTIKGDGMKNQADYSKYECPYSHIDKECGHELHGPAEEYEGMHGIWCACGFRGPVFCLDPVALNLNLKTPSDDKDKKFFDRAFFNDVTGKPYDVPASLRRIAEHVCRHYDIKGICDPMYITNISRAELLDDGVHYVFGRRVVPPLSEGGSHIETAIHNLAKRLMGSYGCNIGKGDEKILVGIITRALEGE
jgi:hypothetical protein